MLRCVAVVTFVLPSFLCLFGFFYSSLPSYSGVYYLHALDNRVTITRDTKAVPVITAATKGDALFGQGFVHAQDRLWSMDITRRTALGRLAEIFGEEALELDTFVRNVGIGRLAAKAVEEMKPATLLEVQRYADGVNAYVRKQHTLPCEYFLTWSYFEDWKPVDSVAITQLMGLSWGFEFLRAKLSHLVGKEVADLLLPYDLQEKTPYIINDEDLPKHIRTSEAQTGNVPTEEEKYTGSTAHFRSQSNSEDDGNGLGKGSNSWVISGKYTKSGKPIIANDTHWPIRIPSLWYLITLKVGTLAVSGGSAPGIPGVLTGRNDILAWTATIAHGDTLDLYIERRNPHNPSEYLHYSGFRPITLFEERIFVKGRSQPVIVTFERTHHGPILKDYTRAPSALGTFLPFDPSLTLSFRWTLAEVQDTSMETVLSLFDAQNVAQLRNALSKLTCCSMGILFASVTNEIGFQMTGRIPNTSHRKQFSNAPLEGWKEENEWRGIVDFQDLPFVLDPAQGFIVAANNM